MPRFFCSQPLALGLVVTLPEAVAHHVNVVRLAPGDAITLFNGDGGEYTAVLNSVEKKRVSAELKAYSERDVELPYALTLAHWQGIIVSASEQSGRNRLAQLAGVDDFKDWIAQQDMHRRIILTPRAGQSLPDWARHQPPQALTLMVGPEGGFTEEEENLALAHGALALSMGPRILRTETAGLTALAALNAIWGGM